MNYKIGDTVLTQFGLGEIVDIDIPLTGKKYLVKHLKTGWPLHNGNIVTKYKSNRDDCYWFSTEELREKSKEVVKINNELLFNIIITTDGKITTATMGDKKAIAKCNPTDQFNLALGAKIAIERLLFKPHLEDVKTGIKWGILGEKSNIVDIFGNQLVIGDIVGLWGNGKDMGKYPVCFNNEDGYFVMGLAGRKFENGIAKDIFTNWNIIKFKSYREVPHRDIIDNIKYVKEVNTDGK